MNSPKIVKIKVLEDIYSILVLFDNEVTKIVDFSNKINEEFYSDLSNKLLFKQAHIDVGGYGLSWNDDIDISEYELWNIGKITNHKLD